MLATERVTLYGVPIVAQRQVNYGASPRRWPASCSCATPWSRATGRPCTSSSPAPAAAGRGRGAEHRARRRDILVDDHALFDFYDQRIPDDVVSARHFDAWWKRARQGQPDLLDFERSMLIGDAAGAADAAAYPDTWEQEGHRLRLTYQFEPGSDADGVTVHVPLAVLNQIDPDGFDWQVPGLRQELVTELIRSPPKAIRRSFIPAPTGRPRPWSGSALATGRCATRWRRAGAGRAGGGPHRGVRPGQDPRPPAHDLPGGGPPGSRAGPVVGEGKDSRR